MERGDSQSSSDSSGAKHGSSQPCDLSGHLRINYLSRHSIDSPGIGSGSDCPRVKEPPPGGGGGIVGGSADNYSYVQLTAVHEYIYPSIEDRRDSLKKSSLETPLTSTTSSIQPALPTKKKDKRKNCKHCQVRQHPIAAILIISWGIISAANMYLKLSNIVSGAFLRR